MSRHRGVAMALVVSGVALAVQYGRHRDRVETYDRHVLPAFDAYVYVAMAERPAVFTVGPWGYRLLTPALVHVLSPSDAPRGFRWVTVGCFVLAGPLLFLLLRRLGHGEVPALVAVGVYGLSEPVGETLRYLFLTEPLSLVLLLGLVLSLEAGGGPVLVLLLVVLGALTKEAFLYFLPVVYLARWDRDGHQRALGGAALAAAGALALRLALQRWTAYLPPASSPGLGAETVWLAAYRILAGWEGWWSAALLWGVTPLAVLGAFRRAARPFLRRYGYLLAFTLALPFAASVYTEDRDNVPFFAQDIPRLMVLALPLLLSLALTAVDRVWPHRAPPSPRWKSRPSGALAAALLTAAVFAALLGLDPYRRVDLRGPRDGRMLLALSRQSLAFARRLERGRPLSYEPEGRRFTPGRSDPHLLERMRWFLRDGWGENPHLAMGPVVMRASRAALLLPCFAPVDLEAGFTASAPEPGALAVLVNGRPAGELHVGPGRSSATVVIPASALFRGDNRIELDGRNGAGPGTRLHGLVVRRAGARAPARDASGGDS